MPTALHKGWHHGVNENALRDNMITLALDRLMDEEKWQEAATMAARAVRKASDETMRRRYIGLQRFAESRLRGYRGR